MAARWGQRAFLILASVAIAAGCGDDEPGGSGSGAQAGSSGKAGAGHGGTSGSPAGSGGKGMTTGGTAAGDSDNGADGGAANETGGGSAGNGADGGAANGTGVGGSDNGMVGGAPGTGGGGGTSGAGASNGVGGAPGGGDTARAGEGGQAGASGALAEAGEGGHQEPATGGTGGTENGTGGSTGGTSVGGSDVGGTGGGETGGSGGTSGTGGTGGATGGAGGSGGPPPVCAPVSGPESCNGIDDDCDGVADELGTFSCGIGACKNTVTACVNAAVQACVPLAPQAGPDGCDGIDNDCDGAVDEDCAECVHVALTGDDTSASANAGATPFLTVQAAIDYAATHPAAPRRVCVAAGAACGSAATYPGPSGADLEMADGIDVLANYESTSWTRCTNSTTHLAPTTGSGVVFPAEIESQTVLDGFTIDRPALPGTVVGVTVDGAHGALISNVIIANGANGATASYGVDLKNGADGTVFHSAVDSGPALDSAAVRATSARVAVEDNCDAFDGRGRCTSGCALLANRNSAQVHSAYAVLLDDALGSKIERSGLCEPYQWLMSAVVRVTGDADGAVIRGNSIRSLDARVGNSQAVRLDHCAGASPWLVDNPLVSQSYTHGNIGSSASGATATVGSDGDCRPVIEANPVIEVLASYDSNAAAISCSDGSGCVISNNPDVRNTIPATGATTTSSVPLVGVYCRGCTRIDHNAISGVKSACTGLTCRRTGIGLDVSGAGLDVGNGTPWVSSNRISGGSGRIYATGVRSDAVGARFENNVIMGSPDLPSARGDDTKASVLSTTGFQGTGDVHSNFIVGHGTATPTGSDCWSQGALLSGGGTFRNNIITSGSCGIPVLQYGTLYPDAFDNDALYNATVHDPGTGQDLPGILVAQTNSAASMIALPGRLSTAAEIDATAAMHASGTLDALCPVTSDQHLLAGSPCIDAGTATGAPLLDFDGESRDASPDIGADEYVP